MKFHIVINPVAASGATLKRWKKAEKTFIKSECEYVVHQSTKTHTITDIVHELTSDLQEDINLVVVGGDGTMNEVVNGISDFEHTRIGLLPCGSGNDMVRDMDLPKKTEDLVNRILMGRVHHVSNVGMTTFLDGEGKGIKQKFLVSSGMGFDAQVCHEVSISRLKPILNKIHLGSLIYIVIAFKVLNRKIRFHLKSEKEYDETMFVSVHNHQYEGGGFRFAPNARFDDDILDLCVVHHVSIPKFLRLFVSAYDGSHVKYENHVAIERGKSAVLKTDRKVWVHCDGETRAQASSIKVEVLDEKLKFLI